MTPQRNNGTHVQKDIYPYIMTAGTRGSVDYQVFYFTVDYACSCGRVRCQHEETLRQWLENGKQVVAVGDNDGVSDWQLAAERDLDQTQYAASGRW